MKCAPPCAMAFGPRRTGNKVVQRSAAISGHGQGKRARVGGGARGGRGRFDGLRGVEVSGGGFFYPIGSRRHRGARVRVGGGGSG